MIVVDTSALMAILLDEPQAPACIAALEAEPEVLVSAGTLAEALIVAGRRRVAAQMTELVEAWASASSPSPTPPPAASPPPKTAGAGASTPPG